MPFGNPWQKKKGESDEEHIARTDKMRQQSRERLAEVRDRKKSAGDRKPQTSDTPLVKKAAITQTVSILNGFVGMFSPADALGKIGFAGQEIDEQKLLVDAIYEQQETSKWFRGKLGAFVNAAGSASLLGAVALIVYVRLERRGIVPSMSGSVPPEGGNGQQPYGAEAQSVGPTRPSTAPTDPYWAEQEWQRNHPEGAEIVGAG